jgi:hypothetical protein
MISSGSLAIVFAMVVLGVLIGADAIWALAERPTASHA